MRQDLGGRANDVHRHVLHGSSSVNECSAVAGGLQQLQLQRCRAMRLARPEARQVGAGKHVW